MSRTLSCLKKESGISLEMPQWKKASSPIKRNIYWFFSNCARKLGIPLELRRGPQEHTPVASGISSLLRVSRALSGFLSSRCRGRGPHLEFRMETQVSPQFPTWISAFLWSFHRGDRPRLVWSHASLLSSRARKAVSGFLLG